MKVPHVDPQVTGSFKRTLNTALLIWATNASVRRRDASTAVRRYAALASSGAIGAAVTAQLLWAHLAP